MATLHTRHRFAAAFQPSAMNGLLFARGPVQGREQQEIYSFRKMHFLQPFPGERQRSSRRGDDGIVVTLPLVGGSKANLV